MVKVAHASSKLNENEGDLPERCVFALLFCIAPLSIPPLCYAPIPSSISLMNHSCKAS